jgi:cytidyltransferase-like protein
MTAIFFNGCFDGLHAGHLRLIYEACFETRCWYAYVALNSDDYIRRAKGLEPLMLWKARQELLSLLRPVLAVQPCEADVTPIFRRYVVHGLIGTQWYWGRTEGSTFTEAEEAFIEERKVKVVYVPELKGLRSLSLYDRKCLEAIKQ